jgi:flagellar hook-length control protein FliK
MTFAELLAAGRSGVADDAALQPAGAPSTAKDGGRVPESDEPAALPAAADNPAAVMLFAAFGSLPIAHTGGAAEPAVDQPHGEGDGAYAPAFPGAGDRDGHTAMLALREELAGPRTSPAVPADADSAARELAATELIELPADLSFGAHVAMMDARPAANAVARAPVMAELRTPVNLSGWDVGLGKTLVWMAEARHGFAEIRLNPPALGPLEIVIALGGDDGREARVAFASPHAAVREAIESAMPRLREMMAESGINLGRTAVGAESFHRPDHPDRHGSQGTPADGAGDTHASPQTAEAVPALRARLGIVDLFA